jgi:transcriptional regulator with XRE-family HTH domain
MLGEEIRKARLKAGLTQEQLGFAAKLDRTYISMLENERVALPTLTVLFRLCDALGVRASQIIARVEKQRSRPRR